MYASNKTEFSKETMILLVNVLLLNCKTNHSRQQNYITILLLSQTLFIISTRISQNSRIILRKLDPHILYF